MQVLIGAGGLLPLNALDAGGSVIVNHRDRRRKERHRSLVVAEQAEPIARADGFARRRNFGALGEIDGPSVDELDMPRAPRLHDTVRMWRLLNDRLGRILRILRERGSDRRSKNESGKRQENSHAGACVVSVRPS